MAVHTDRDQRARYARLADGWIGLRAMGVEEGTTGELRLQTLPDPGTATGPDLAQPAPYGPPGCALDDGGTGFVSEPAEGRVRIMTSCLVDDGLAGDLVGRRPSDTELLPGSFTTPRGLLLGPRGRLYVADTDAIVVVDPGTGTITGVWGDVEAGWCLARIADWIYVLDRGGDDGTGRVRRFSPDGHHDTVFDTAVSSITGDPVRMAADGELLLVVMRQSEGPDEVVPLHPDGAVAADWADAWAHPSRVEQSTITGQLITAPVGRFDGIAINGDRALLIDEDRGDLLSFTVAGEYIGTTHPTHAAADIFASSGQVLWTYPREPGQLLRHDARGAFVRGGTFVCGPIDTATEHDRRELRVRFDYVAGAHLQLWTTVKRDGPLPGPETIPLTGGFVDSVWSALPGDVDAALISDPAGPQLLIGGRLAGDGAATPTVHQIAVGGSPTWLDQLPAVYRKNPSDSDFLDRYLRLLQSVQAETAQERMDLVRRFDPWTAEDSAQGSAGRTVLDDLADWLALDLDERWPVSLRRGVVAHGFCAQAQRGTHRGLRAAIHQRLPGLKVVDITEPAQRAHVWPLPAPSGQQACECRCNAGGLGFDTMLAAASPDGAVVGTTAVVAQSTLTGGANAGGPLFADLAHRFHVSVVPAAGRDATSLDADLRALIEAEKPAHTVYTLCIARPRARVGAQARIGIDAIVASPAPQLDLDVEPGLGDTTLGAAGGRGSPATALLGQTRLGGVRLT